MFSRTSRLTHPSSGVSLATPLLIPSFSSKAYGWDHRGEPQVRWILDAAQEFMTGTCLVSAYDIHYGYLPSPQNLKLTVDLMVLDSGGYEASADYDLSAVEKHVHRPRQWDTTRRQAIWDQWPSSLPAVLVSYDHSNDRQPVTQQLRDAKQAALTAPGHLHSFLLKPETQGERRLEPALQALQAQVGELTHFQLLGVTEKELGNSPLERMVCIAGLRRALDDASVDIPIHVFGALEPLAVCLYFAAGAEVFDGLTWSRYAYTAGQCVYVHSNGTVAYGPGVNDDEAHVRTIMDNLRYLDQLQRSLRLWAKTGDWTHVSDNQEVVRGAVAEMMSRVERAC